MEENSQKKGPLEDLPKEELVKKCKALLVLLQKAKQAKSDVSSELNAVKENCQKLEKKNAADQESLRTMQEFIETLTEQKLYHTTEIDSLRNLNNKQKISIDECEAKILKYERDNAHLNEQLKQSNVSLTNTDNEITSLKRQNGRLEGDNEKLINQLGDLEDEIEKLKVLGLQQQQQLLALEKDNTRVLEPDSTEENAKSQIDDFKLEIEKINVEKSSLSKSIEELLKQIEEKNEIITNFEEESSKYEASINETKSKLTNNELKLSETEKLYETEKSKKEKLNLRLKLYKDKLVKCNASISHLKNSKSVLLKTVSDYSESVPKWQQDIMNASKLLSEQLLKLEFENVELKNQLSSESKSNDSKLLEEERFNVLNQENNSLTSKLNSVENDLKKIQEECLSYSNEVKAKQIENESLINNNKSLVSEKLILINEKKSAKDTIIKIENEKTELHNRITELSEKMEQINNERSQWKMTLDNMKSEKHENDDYKMLIKENEENYKCAQDTIESLRDEISSVKCAIVAVEEENKLLHESNEMLKSQLNNESDDQPTLEMRRLIEQNDLLQTDISKLQTKASSYKHENTSMHNELKEARQRLIDLENVLQDYESMKAKFSNYKSENSELLKEMKEINQVLKERGEVISKQQMEIAELTRKSHTADEDIKILKENIEKKNLEFKKISDALKRLEEESEKYQTIVAERDHLEGLLKERNTIIISLEDDIEKLKQNTGNVSYDARSDNMSVSTVSKVEENSRLKDLDESFEERYSKLRVLALKLKKRVGELTVQNKSLEEANVKLEEEKQGALLKTKLANNPSETFTDVKLDNNTYQNMNTNELIKQAEKLTTELSAANSKVNNVSKNLELCKMEKASLDIIVKEYQSKMSSQKNSQEELKLKEAELVKIKDTLALKESQLTLEESQHQITREALEKSKKEVKKKSVLSLEMEDYERSMKDMTNKMEEDKKKIIQMESTIDTQQATVTSLKTQIRMLEEQLHSEEKVSKELRDLLSKATENLKEKENLISSKNESASNLEKNLEELKLQNEDINLQLASALGDKEKVILSLETEKSDLITRFKIHENKFNDIQEQLKIKSIELEELKAEFSGYKVRAQSVLRQNNSKDLSLEENLKEEMAAFKVEIESLRNESSQLKMDLESVQLERSQLSNRCNELQSSINLIKIDREKISEQYSILLQKEAQEQNNFKLQMSTLTQCYKKQLSDLEESSAGQIAKLKKELEFSRASIARAGLPTVSDANGLKKQFQFVTIESNQHSEESIDLPVQENNSTDEINVALLEREEGEGSESTPSPSPTNRIKRQMQRGKREPMPLEQLLEVDIPDDSTNSYSDLDIEQQLVNALKQIEIRDRRLSHMTEIVAEAEKEVARRSQLVETLKEEVRRCQRALDRGVHHHNQEYLKNVIVKFLTLSAGDERTRLVPVLNTILTLSPEETNQLNAAARGIDSNANRSWGSYLPWPSK